MQNVVRAGVTIRHASNVAVSGAAVTVAITVPGGSQTIATRTTNARGRASFSTPATASGTYTFTVTNVIRAGHTYDPATNVETSDSVMVP